MPPPTVDLTDPRFWVVPEDVDEQASHRTWETFPPRKRAAVLALVTPTAGGDLALLVTQRSTKLRVSPGDCALPGGKVDLVKAASAGTAPQYEDEWTCALREAYEEIGFVAASPSYTFTRLATLPCYPSMGHDSVRMCVAYVESRAGGGGPVPLATLAPSVAAAEVELAFTIPLRPLLRHSAWYITARSEWHGDWVYHRYEVPLGDVLEVARPRGSGSEGGPALPPHAQPRLLIKGLTGHFVNDVARVLYPDVHIEMIHMSMIGANAVCRNVARRMAQQQTKSSNTKSKDKPSL